MSASAISTTVVDDRYELIDFGVSSFNALAGFSLRNTDEPADYSMRRPQFDNMSAGPFALRNWTELSRRVGFNLHDSVMSRRWLIQGRRVRAIGNLMPGVNVEWDKRTNSWNPISPADTPEMENSCDGLLITSQKTMGLSQAGDCSNMYVVDVVKRLYSIEHCSWYTVASNIVTSTIAVFLALGSDLADLRVYVSPDVGDDYHDFQDDTKTRGFMTRQGRAYLLDPAYGFLRPFEDAAKQEYHEQWGDPIKPFGSTVLAVSAIIEWDLLNNHLDPEQIYVDMRPGLMLPTFFSIRRQGTYLRDGHDLKRSNHGLNLCFIGAARL